MSSRLTCYITLVFLLSTAKIQAQEIQAIEPSAGQTGTFVLKNSAGIFLERNFNTFNWIGRAAIDTTVASTSFKLAEQYSSNIILLNRTSTAPRRNLESTQQQIFLRVRQPVTNNMKLQTQWSSLVYDDNKAVGLSRSSFHSLLGGIEYNPYTYISISPMAGYRWDNQLDIRDRGLSYDIAAMSKGISLDGYNINGQGQYHEDRLDPRLLQNHFARVSVEKYFLGNTRDSLELGWSKNRRDFYTVGGSGVESRIDNIFSFGNLLDYEFDQQLVASVFVGVVNRTLDKDNQNAVPSSPVQFDTEIDEFRLETYIQAVYRNSIGKPVATARLYHHERNETHTAKRIDNASREVETLYESRNRQEQTKDNLSRRTALSSVVQTNLTRSDTLFVSGTASILRYDTPSAANVEDRDELLLAASIVTAHNISQYMDVAFSLGGNLSHVVYLLPDRSANNNYNRVLRFSPRITYRPTRDITTFNAFEVLANYTVYDFEERLVQIKSFSYRQFAWLDSTSIELTRRIGLDFHAYLKLYERGQLRWSEFRERRENSFVDRTFAGQVRFKPTEGVLMAVGLRYFSQSRYAYNETEKRLELFLRSIGPTCLIAWEINRYSRFSIRGWYEQRRQENGSTESLANMAMNILFTF